MDLKSVLSMRNISVGISKELRRVVLNDPKIVNHKEVKEIVKVLLNILELSVTTSGVDTRSIDVNNRLDFAHYIEHLEQILENVQVVLGALQTSGTLPTTVNSENHYFTLKVVKEDLKQNITLTELLQKHSDIPVFFSKSSMNRLQKLLDQEKDLSLGVVITNKVAFKTFNNHSISNLIFVFLSQYTEGNNKMNVRSIISPVEIEVRLRLNESSVQVSQTIPLDPRQDEDGLDFLIRVHRLEPGSQGRLTVAFLYPPTIHVLRVLIVRDQRPTYRMMMTQSALITHQAPYYSLETESDSLYYMGVIPGPGVSPSRSIFFSFTVNSTTCVTWDKVGWSPTGCRVGPNTIGHRIHCQCTHLSIFAAIFPYSPNKIDPVSDIKLVLTLRDNPINAIAVLVLFFFYLIFCMIGKTLDKKDYVRGTISFLEDNYPYDKYPYLLAVFTSSRLFAGTTSHVGIQIFGQRSSSRAHILKNELYQVFDRQSDDWFLILCPKHLGIIEYLHLWHDNTGSTPDWYCDKIHVFDLKKSLEFLFIVEQWIRLNVSNFPEALVLTASSNDILEIHRVLSNNVFNHLRDYQSIVGIFTQHPRNTVKRLQRVNIFSCNLSIALLCNIMFYVDTSTEIVAYNLKTRGLYVSFITVAALVSFNYMVSSLFKKSYYCVAENTPNSMFLRKSLFPEHLLGSSGRKSTAVVFYRDARKGRSKKVKGESIRERLVKIVKLIVISQKLVPATLPHGESALKINKMWYFITWMVCSLTRILCMYFILLYGFKMGYVKSKKWLTTYLVAFMENKIIINPMNLILIAFSIISSFGFVRGTTNYRVTKKEIQMSIDQIPFTALFELYQKRQDRRYSPLSSDKREELLRKKVIRLNKIRMAQFVLSLSYVICITCIVQRVMHTSFLRVSHLEKMFDSTPWVNSSVSFRNVYNNVQLSDYLTKTFLHVVFKSTWYNNMTLYGKESNFLYKTSDYYWQTIGIPYIRQKRVFEKACRSMAPPRGWCVHRWSLRNEDKGSYDVGWSSYSPYDARKSTFLQAWHHSRPSKNWLLTLYRLQGKSGTIYDNGGYRTKLECTLEGTVDEVAHLTNNSWIDEFTKAMFMELVVYNVDINTLGQITLIMEFLTSGVTLKAARITTVIVDCEVFGALLVVYSVLTLVFVIEICFEINHGGITTFYKDVKNILLVTIVIPSIFVIISTLTDIYYCKFYRLRKNYYNHVNDYFDFDTYIAFDLLLTYVLSFFFFFSVLRTLLLMRNVKIHEHILKLITWSSNSLFFILSITFLCFVFQFKILVHLDISTWGQVMEMIVAQKKPRYVRSEYFSSDSIILSFLKFVSITLASSLLVTTFVCVNPIVRSSVI